MERFPMALPQFTRQMTIPEWEALFPDDEACKAYLAHGRWAHWNRRLPSLHQ
jgi:hypothetical protein